MGIGGIGIWQLLIVLGIAVLLFGTSRLRSLGSDLGGAIKGFRNAMESDDGDPPRSAIEKASPAALCGERDPGASEQAHAPNIETRV